MAKQKKPTVKVRILVPVAGAGFSWYPGQVVDMPEAEAAKWADGERGEYVTAPPARDASNVGTTPAQPVDGQPGQTGDGTEPPAAVDQSDDLEQTGETGTGTEPPSDQPDAAGESTSTPADDEHSEEAEVRAETPEPTGTQEQPVRGGQTVETTESAKRPARGRRGTGRGKAGSVETT